MQRSPTCENCQRNYELKDLRPVGPKVPVLLPCGHTFCEGCLTKAAKMKNEISCFLCEETFPLIPKGELGVKNFLPNIYVLGLLLYNRRIALESASTGSLAGAVTGFNGIGIFLREKHTRSTNQSEQEVDTTGTGSKEKERIICDECNLRHATCQCKICSLKLCEGCFKKVHSASKVFNKHSPLPLEYPSEAELCCSIHPDRLLEFYDKDTKDVLCSMCAISEKHKLHEIIPISEMSQHSSEELEEAIEKSKETLLWLKNSSKNLTKALPEEVYESNDLFDDIHAKFTACHTLLLKRQIELTAEASQKLSISGSITDTLQEISNQINSISSSIKDYEMIKNDKRALTLKSEEFLEKFRKSANAPCIADKVSEEEKSRVRLDIPETTISTIENFGDVVAGNRKKFELKRPSDLSAEKLEELKTKIIRAEQPVQTDILKANEILDENLDQTKKQSKLSRLMLPQGNFELVYVTHLKDPSDFKVQRYADKDRLQVMMTALNNYCKKANTTEDLVYKVEEGMLVCGQFMADNMWYRARIINAVCPTYPGKIPTWQNGLTVEVLYIDYGNSEWLPLNRLRKLKSTFMEIPEMAVPCSLTDIVPPYKEVTWPQRSIKAFNSLTGEKPLLMNIRKRMNGKLYVDLRKPDDDEPTLDDDRPISVRDALVFLEVAVFFSPASQPNSDLHRPSRTYKEPELLEKEKFLDVVVTHADDPHSIYIQRLDSIISDEQQYLTKLYSGRNKNQWKVDWPYRNLVVSARYSADKTWYRAVVKQVNVDETVLVEYVDYGNSETLTFNEIKKIPPMYLELPKQCWKVKLYGMDKKDDEQEWSSLAKLYLQEKFQDKPFVAVVRNLDEHKVAHIELYDTLSERDINMNFLLIEQGFVKDLGLIKKVLKQDVEEVVESDGTKEDDNIPETEEGKEEEDNIELKEQAEEITCNQYLPCDYPVGEFSATGVYVDKDANIFVHVNDEDSSLSELMQYLNSGIEFPPSPKTTDSLKVGQACLGKFSQDGLWYRVKITKIENEREISVYFVDFGNCECIEVKDLIADPHFEDVPAQCVKIMLAGIEPLDKECAWSEVVILYLTEVIVSEEFMVSIIPDDSKSDHKYASIKLANDSDVAQNMIDAKLVRYKNSLKNTASRENDSTQEPFLQNKISEEVIPEPIENNTDGYFQYKEDQFLVSETPISVLVTQVDLPELIYIQCCNESYLEELEALSGEINSEGYFDGIKLTIALRKGNVPIGAGKCSCQGMACIAKFGEDEQYYRARINDFDEEMGVADVMFVDYGNSETVPLAALKPITTAQIQLPALATKARIHGISPVTLPNDHIYKDEDFVHGTGWLVESMKQFYNLVANKKMSAIVKKICTDIIVIDLYDEIHSEETGETKEVLVAEVMTQNNIAQYNS